MSDYHFAGLNAWTYSQNRAILWVGLRGSHYSDRRHLKYERGEWGYLGLEVTFGGDERDIELRIGLGVTTIYIGVTGLVNSNQAKVEKAAKQQNCYAYELDYAYGGRTTGVMAGFHGIKYLRFSVWCNGDSWTARKSSDKFKCFPYCEGWEKSIFWQWGRND